LFVKTHSELNSQALASGQDRELVVWYLARSLDSEGRGAVHLEDLERQAADLDISRGNLARRLRRGAGPFWTLQDTERGRVVRLQGLAKVCEALDVVPFRAPVAVPLEDLRGLARARAALQATVTTGRTIGRQTIEDLTGATRSTQRRREKLAGVQASRNMARKPYERGEVIPAGGFVARDRRGVLWLNKPMANSYWTALQALPRGRLKKARQLLRTRLKERGAEQPQRVYFSNGVQAHKCQNRADTFYVDERKEWHGYRLWAWLGA